MEQTPEQPPAPEAPPTARDVRVEARLHTIIEAKVPLVAWARGWVSRDRRLHALFAARTLDFALLTEPSLFLVTSGFFTRRPRRLVYSARLDEIAAIATVTARGHRVRITGASGRALLIEMRAGVRGDAFVAALVARTKNPSPDQTRPEELAE